MAVENCVKVEAIVHPTLANVLLNEKRRELTKLEDFYNCGVFITVDPKIEIENTRVTSCLENDEKVVIS
jgi:Ribonuclease G/E